MDEFWWRLLALLNLLVLAVALQTIFELKSLFVRIVKALPTALESQVRIADDISKIELHISMRNKTHDELARELEWDIQKERIRKQRNSTSGGA